MALNASHAQTMRAIERDRLAGEPVGVAVAVPVLVARAHDAADVAEQAADPLQHLLALDRVRLDDRALLGVELAGLVDDLRRDADLADVVQQRRRTRRRGDRPTRAPSSSQTREHEIDDVAAVDARVRVVGLDDVAEQERRAAVRVAQLERVVDPALPLAARTCRSSPTSGRTSTTSAGCVLRRERDGQAERRESERRRPRRRPRKPSTARGAMPVRRGRRSRRRCEVERELRGERRRGRPATPTSAGAGRPRARARASARARGTPSRASGSARVGSRSGHGRSATVAQDEPRGDGAAARADREREEHRHEHELRRDRRAAADLELDARDERVEPDEEREPPGRERRPAVQEAARRGSPRRPRPPPERANATRARQSSRASLRARVARTSSSSSWSSATVGAAVEVTVRSSAPDLRRDSLEGGITHHPFSPQRVIATVPTGARR